MSERPPPENIVQAAGQAATDVIGGLRQQPLVLALVVLNCIGIGTGIWFLIKVAEQSHQRWLELVKQCFEHMPAPL